MVATATGADVLSNSMLATLTTGKSFTIPDIDLSSVLFDQPLASGALYAVINPIDMDDLTIGVVNGTGIFDKLMTSLVKHLKVEYEANRISGAEYTKAYVGIITAALQTSTQVLLSKDATYWQALMVQQQARAAEAEAVRARLELETTRVVLSRSKFEAAIAEANYGLTKMKISTEDATYGNMVKQGEGLDYTNATILPLQATLLAEQAEVQRSQTLDTRSDAVTTITGSVGKQKDLYTQQITSYQRDAETKAAKIFSDAWITQKTIDEGVLAPTNFTNAELDEVLTILRTNLNLTP